MKLSVSLVGGNKYRVRIIASSPTITGKDNGADITITQRATLRLVSDAGNSVCPGKIVNLRAELTGGTAPFTYLWSNGESSPSISVAPISDTSLSIKVSENSCGVMEGSITFKLNSQGKVELGKDLSICPNTTLSLKAPAGYKTYLWHEGTKTPNLTICQPGIYSVTVVDECDNVSKDSVTVASKRGPSNFLPLDLSICTYETIKVQSITPFSNYLWSTEETTQEIRINKPGTYSLKVIDADNCVGQDTILVRAKNCIEGVFIPTAFSPNGDRKNDIFRPFVNADLKSYRLTVFNRWGQIVFETTDSKKGWTGALRGIPRPSDAYVISCNYQTVDGFQKQQNETIMLVR